MYCVITMTIRNRAAEYFVPVEALRVSLVMGKLPIANYIIERRLIFHSMSFIDIVHSPLFTFCDGFRFVCTVHADCIGYRQSASPSPRSNVNLHEIDTRQQWVLSIDEDGINALHFISFFFIIVFVLSSRRHFWSRQPQSASIPFTLAN